MCRDGVNFTVETFREACKPLDPALCRFSDPQSYANGQPDPNLALIRFSHCSDLPCDPISLYPSHLCHRSLCPPTSGSARRRARERRLALQNRLEGETLVRERREQRAREKMEQQGQTRAELASYEPWGRAGGGAPNKHSLRRTDLRAGGIFPEDELRGISIHEARRRWPGRRRRRRTPRVREDPKISYTDHLGRTIDNDIRYRQTPDQQTTYRHILDDMVDKRKREEKDEMKRNMEYERKLQAMDGPWGKPGPGGTTWRHPRHIGLNFSKSMGWTDNDLFNKMQFEHKRYKRSSLTLPNVKRDDDSKERSKDKENKKPNDLILPDIKHTNSSQNKATDSKEESVRTSMNGTQVNDDSGTAKSKSKKKKFVKRLSNGEKIRRVVPDEDEDEAHLTPEEWILRATGGVELVPLLARRQRPGARTLHSSDVTRPPDQSCQWREMLNSEYLRELKHQVMVKHMQKEEARLNSAESARQHQATCESMWGRPGHGAPQRGRYARSNLARLLYVAPLNN